MTLMLRYFIVFAFGALVPALSLAGEAEVAVEKQWARASIGTARPAAAYLTIRNAGDQPVSLTGLRSKVAGKAEVHASTTGANGVSTMAPAGDIEIAPGEAVTLEPGGLHIMLMNLTAPLTEGGVVPLVLEFEDGTEVTVEIPVLGIGARGPAS